MKNLIVVTLFLIVTLISAKAQSVLVTGKIFEQGTKTPIANATIKCGNFGSSSIKDGSFRLVLNQEIVNQLGLTISCIGFETQRVKYKEGLEVFLKPSNLQLNEVIVGIGGLSIIEKAIARIEINYPQKDFTMTGYIKMHQIAKNDTADFKFFRNEAIVKVGVSPYTKNATDSKIKLIQNRNLLQDSLSNEENYVRFVQGYLIPSKGDFVHNRSVILNNSNLKKYEYYLSIKTTINGRRTYVITFNSLKKRDNEGIIYIDSASYAIVRLNTTSYNFQPAGSISINEASRTINYQKIKDKWYLQNVSSNTKAIYNNINYSRFEEYHTISIDSNKLDVNYIDVIQELTEDLQVNNIVNNEKWISYQPFIDSLTKTKLVSDIKAPIVPINYIKQKEKLSSKFRNAFRGYIVNGGFRTNYRINQSPLKIDGFQPLLNKSLYQFSNYTISLGTQFKLYKNLFLESAGGYNFGIGGIKIEQNDYLVTYNFVFNKTHHPLTISPSFGYSNIELGKKKAQFYYQESLLYKLNFTYEQKRRLSYTLLLTYLDPFYQRNNGIILNNLKFVPSIGIMKRF
jgi:hypothetical protein